jgi:hypothetical protein
LVSGRFATGAFCLFGGKLQKDADTSIYNTQLPPGQYALIGAGSDNVRDVDIFVLKQTGRDDYGVEVTKDTEVDNTPICTFTVRSGYYRLKHKNYDSTGPGFVFSVLLRF